MHRVGTLRSDPRKGLSVADDIVTLSDSTFDEAIGILRDYDAVL